jgi:hypothetical protein
MPFGLFGRARGLMRSTRRAAFNWVVEGRHAADLFVQILPTAWAIIGRCCVALK